MRHALQSYKNILKTRYILILLSIVLFLAACSTQHNTWLSRSYQRMTSHYNVYFNGKEAFNDGLEKVNQATKEDYSRILPVYNFCITQNAKPANGDMETALKKAHKLVELHSIKVKPAHVENPTPRQRELQLKDEYNPYVAEAYLLMGQANVVLHDEKEAFKVLEYVHQKFPSEHAAYESLIWKSIAHAQIGQFAAAKGALDSYDLDGLAPNNLYFDYQRARANIHLELEEYSQAIPYLENAIKEGSSRENIRRLKYILAQVYREVGHPEKAVPLFRELSRSVADYNMAFAAKMELATVSVTDADMQSTEKLLRKMARETKNEEFLDQIYYSLGKLQQTQGNTDLANVFYRKSVNTSTSNTHQKGLSYLAMSDIAASKSDYLPDGLFVDSASQFLSATNLRKPKAQDRAKLLKPLVKELQTIHDNDSLMRIANMSDRDRDAFLKKIIDTEKKRLEALEAQKAALEDAGMSQTDFYRISNGAGERPTRGGSSWYFYNTTMIQAGKAAFIKKWGQRANEDDWRRADKSSSSPMEGFPDDFSPEELAGGLLNGDNTSSDNDANKESDNSPVSTSKLLEGLPMTDDAKAKINEATANALFKSATILYDDIHDYTSASRQFDELLRRFPKIANRYDALTLLYFSATKAENTSLANSAAQSIRSEYPDSEFAAYLKQGADSYFAATDKVLQEHEAKYRSAYDAYLLGQFAQSYSLASQALGETSEADYHSKYLLIRALSSAKQGQRTAFEADLRDITDRYANTPEDTLARAFLDQLALGKAPVVHQSYDSPLEENRYDSAAETAANTSAAEYKYSPEASHSVVAFVDNDMQNRALFLIADYNFTNFLLDDYDLAILTMANGSMAIQVSGFANQKAAMAYFFSLREQSLFSEVSPSRSIPLLYAIPTDQVRILTQDKSLEYDTFFQEHYMNSLLP